MRAILKVKDGKIALPDALRNMPLVLVEGVYCDPELLKELPVTLNC